VGQAHGEEGMMAGNRTMPRRIARLSRYWLLALPFSLVMFSAIPADAGPIVNGVKIADSVGLIRFNGPKAAYGVRGLINFDHQNVTDVFSAPYEYRNGVEMYFDSAHWLYFGYEQLQNCSALDASCMKWFVQTLDGSCLYCADAQARYFGNQPCTAWGGLGTFTIRSNSPGVWDFIFQCPGLPQVQLYSTADNSFHPALSFTKARAAVEFEQRNNASAKAVVTKLTYKLTGVAAGGWDQWSLPTCGVDSIMGWDGHSNLYPDGGTVATFQVSSDKLGC